MSFGADLDEDYDEDYVDRGRRRSPTAYLRRRWLRLLLLTASGVVVLGVVWIVVTGLVARARLEHARAQLGDLRSAVISGDASHATKLLHDVDTSVASAHALTSGPAWWLAAQLPVVGSPARTTRVIAEQTRTLTHSALASLPTLARQFAAPQTGGTRQVDLTALTAAGPTLRDAGVATQHAVATIRATGGSWLPVVSSARTRVLHAFATLAGQLQGADRATHILDPMLGGHGTKRYFIGFLNEAESRPLGGIPGSYAVATATDGRIRFEQFGSDDDLSGVHADVDLGAAYAARYRQDTPTAIFQNSDVSPDFRDAARIWAGMWQAKTGEHIDGALAVDPTALSYLLQGLGPVTLPGGGKVDSHNVVALTQQTQYTRYPSNSKSARSARKQFLVDIARTISGRLIKSSAGRSIVKGFVRAAAERRLVVWSADSTVEQRLVQAGWAGVLGSTDGATYSGFTVTNGAGSKLDYYLQRSFRYQRFDCGAGATATASVALHNGAPRSGLPHYVTIRADKHGPGVRPGDNLLLVTYYATHGARIASITLDGVRQPVRVQPEGTTIAASVAVELPAGHTRRLVVSVREPATDRAVQVLRQPGVHAQTDHVDDCR